MPESKNDHAFCATVHVQPAISSCRLGGGNPYQNRTHQRLVEKNSLNSLLCEIQDFSYESVIPVLKGISGDSDRSSEKLKS